MEPLEWCFYIIKKLKKGGREHGASIEKSERVLSWIKRCFVLFITIIPFLHRSGNISQICEPKIHYSTCLLKCHPVDSYPLISCWFFLLHFILQSCSPDRSYSICGPTIKGVGNDEFYETKSSFGVQVVQVYTIQYLTWFRNMAYLFIFNDNFHYPTCLSWPGNTRAILSLLT